MSRCNLSNLTKIKKWTFVRTFCPHNPLLSGIEKENGHARTATISYMDK
jgi:hypothetical protein